MLMSLTLTNFAFFGRGLLTFLNTKCHVYQFSGSRVFPCRQMDKGHQSGFLQLLRKTRSVKGRKTY